jgi:hypothetical protein
MDELIWQFITDTCDTVRVLERFTQSLYMNALSTDEVVKSVEISRMAESFDRLCDPSTACEFILSNTAHTLLKQSVYRYLEGEVVLLSCG